MRQVAPRCIVCGGEHFSERCPEHATRCVHGRFLADPCDLCRDVLSAINDDVPDVLRDPDATALVECMNCSAMVEVRTGCKGIDEACSQGWTLDAAGDLNCVSCSEARADLIGEER